MPNTLETLPRSRVFVEHSLVGPPERNMGRRSTHCFQKRGDHGGKYRNSSKRVRQRQAPSPIQSLTQPLRGTISLYSTKLVAGQGEDGRTLALKPHPSPPAGPSAPPPQPWPRPSRPQRRSTPSRNPSHAARRRHLERARLFLRGVGRRRRNRRRSRPPRLHGACDTCTVNQGGGGVQRCARKRKAGEHTTVGTTHRQEGRSD